MLCKTLIMHSLSLIASTKLRKQISEYKKIEPMMINEPIYNHDKCIDKLMQQCKSVIETSESNGETYKLIVQAFLKRFDISFTKQNEQFVFSACIPKAVNKDDIDSIVTQLLKQNNCLDPKKPFSFQDCIFYKTTEALANSSTAALGILVNFAAKNLSELSGKSAECKMIYDPENPYDAKEMLTINWLIKLTKTCYHNSFLHDYQIEITEVDLHYRYKVTFAKVTKHLIKNVPDYIPIAEFVQYYQSVPKGNLKELLELETTNKFLGWANANYKTELAHFIVENKEFFNGLFDLIRKARSTSLNLSCCAGPIFLESSANKTVSCAYAFTPREEILLHCLMHDPINKKMFIPSIFSDFLHYPDDLTTDLRFKDAIKRGIASLSLIIKYAELCFVAKRYEKLNALVEKYTSFCKLCMQTITNFVQTKQNVDKTLCRILSADFVVLGTLSAKDLQTTITNLTCLLDAALMQETIIIRELKTLRTQDIANDVRDYMQNETLLGLNRCSTICNSFLARINDKFMSSLFYNSDDVKQLKELEEKLSETEVELENLLKTATPDEDTKIRILDLHTKGKELKDIIEFEILWLYRTSENINNQSHKAWTKTKDFFVKLKAC